MRDYKKYQKRPVVIEAKKMDCVFFVKTKEGVMTGKAGDYLIKGIEGEFYPCDAEIFHKTYDKYEEKEDA